MKEISFSEKVLNFFEDGEEITLKELYHAVSEDDDIDLSGPTLKHRVRSALYGLQKSGDVERVSDAIYKKV